LTKISSGFHSVGVGRTGSLPSVPQITRSASWICHRPIVTVAQALALPSKCAGNAKTMVSPLQESNPGGGRAHPKEPALRFLTTSRCDPETGRPLRSFRQEKRRPQDHNQDCF
jgi:hypothetical protein